MAATARVPVPRDRENDYTREAADARREFVREQTGADLEHVSQLLVRPRGSLPGNIEHFIGVAQVPIGLAGPLLVDGEHAQGEFYVPLATAEGTLVASYNRGMKLLHEAGGVKTTVMDDAMQRAPAFVFDERARGPRVRRVARASTSTRSRPPPRPPRSSGKLRDIEQYSASRILFTRFNYTTGDAAGQNLTGKATAAACALDHLATTTGDRAVLPRVELRDRQEELAGQHAAHARQARGRRGHDPERADRQRIMHSTTEQLFRARQVSNLGGFMSGVNNNGAHSANGITAMFIATGQDAANVAESSAAFVYAELRAERRLLLLGHDPVADRRDLRRRHRARHAARVPGDARLLRRRQGAQARGDRRRDGALRRAVARLGDRGRGVGRGVGFDLVHVGADGTRLGALTPPKPKDSEGVESDEQPKFLDVSPDGALLAYGVENLRCPDTGPCNFDAITTVLDTHGPRVGADRPERGGVRGQRSCRFAGSGWHGARCQRLGGNASGQCRHVRRSHG